MALNRQFLSALFAAALAQNAAPATAATITVTANAPDELTANGSCSLREAITNVNNGTSDNYPECVATGAYGDGGTDHIVVPAGAYVLDLGGIGEDANANGDYDLLSNVEITGAGASSTEINGGGLDRVFHIASASATVRISGVTITGGQEQGGGIYNGGGTVTLADARIANCSDGLAGYGGAVFNEGGTMTIANSTLANNSAFHAGGGIYDHVGILNLEGATVSGNSTSADDYMGGGGLYSDGGTITVSHSTIRANTTSGYGGGVQVESGTMTTITASTVSDNSAARHGGGLYSYNTAMVITDSTISGNSAAGEYGGGIHNAMFAILSLTNTTVSGNSSGGAGGGLYGEGISATIVHSTFALNAAPTDGEAIAVGGGNTLFLSNTLISSPGGAADCFNTAGGPDSFSLGHNLGTDNSCADAANATDIIAATAGLGALADNGGPTQTHALLTGSAAIDTADCDGGSITTDQRGESRPYGAACDIGAFEWMPSGGGGSGGGGSGSGGGSGGGGALECLWVALFASLAVRRRSAVLP
jgi:hypothetical protein